MTREVREVVRDEPLVRRRLLQLLEAGPLTVPELAAASGHPANEVVIWVMGLRKYGDVTVGEQTPEGYFSYAAAKR